MGEGEDTETPLSTQAPTMVELAWVKLLPFAAPQLPTGKVLNPHVREICECRTVHRVVLKAQRTPTLCNVLDARVGVTWPESVLLQPKH